MTIRKSEKNLVRVSELAQRNVNNQSSRDAVLFLPHAGSDHNSYRTVAKYVKGARTFGIIYPGRPAGSGDGTMHIEEVAHGIAMAFHWDDFERVTVVGHSMGGLVAHALCAALERQGYHPARVIISSAVPPLSKPGADLLPTDPSGVLEHIVALGGTPVELLDSEWFREIYIPMITSDYKAVNHYMLTTPSVVSSRLHLFSSDKDPWISPEAMLSWEAYTTGGTESKTFTGGHFYLLDEPASVAGHFTSDLADTTRSTP